ncbi:MAG: hypothetical protein AAB955_01350 [Patescibacteria group bacterium]
MLGGLLNAGSAAITNQVVGQVTSVAGGIPFGGAIASPPLRCAFPPGAVCVQVLTPPVPIPIICQPGVCRSFLNGPPTFIGQWLLGNALPAQIPCLNGSGVVICTGHPIGATPGHGSSGPISGMPTVPPAQPTQPQSTAAECKDGQIAVKDGESFAQCSQGIKDTAKELCSKYGNGLRLTEGCDTEFSSPEACRAAQASNPSQLCHISRCHYNGTCVDMAFTAEEEAKMFDSNCRTNPNCKLTPYGEQKMNEMFSSADAAGTRVTFETKKSQDALYNQALDVRTRYWQSQGLSAADAKVRAQADVKSFNHVTGVHFSVYSRGP